MQTLDHTSPIIVFTDLDGTLLDHDTYGFAPACDAVSFLKKAGIPLILNSSKTCAEILGIRKELGNRHPFIAENGSVVGIPDGYFVGRSPEDMGFTMENGLWIKCIGGERDDILDVLHRLRNTGGFPFEGFADMTVARLAKITGLSEKKTGLANQRLSTEPIRWLGTDDLWHRFSREIADAGLGWVQGGRFISISRPFDKRDGVELLLDFYRGKFPKSPVTIGLGDSPNDRAMLDIMDIAVVIRSGRSDRVAPENAGTVIRTTLRGPHGWQQAMDMIFKRNT
ncbi:MAG TPA: mannosyl-3-phosphoglycerate phosphatase [Desulfobacteraceae bacterium]|nr:mannosyl-3-phosphoglycerate phosphatase [Desulfobacteraceae bacterium]